MRIARVGRIGWLSRISLGRRSSILGLIISLGRRRSVLRLIVSLLGVSWVTRRWWLVVVVVRIVAAWQGSVGLVGERHRGLDWVGQRSWGSGVGVGGGVSRRVGWSWSSTWGSRADSGWRNTGRRRSGRGV